MAYTTEAAVRTASGFSNTTNITTGTITSYIADADSVIDSKIGEIYTLPLSETPQIIETLSRFITVGLLYANEYGEESQGTDKGWQTRLEWAMDQLEAIRNQETKLYDSTGTELARNPLKQPTFRPTAATSAAGQSDEPYLSMREVF